MTTGLNNLFYKFSRISETLLDAAVATLYPSRCRVCGCMVETWRDGVACDHCWREVNLESQAGDYCGKCWTKLKPLPSQVDVPERRCGKCDSFPFGVVRACGPYEGALRESVLWLKRQPNIPPRLGGALRRTFAVMPESHLIESIIPVPLHPDRRANRGFNQAEVIARELISPAGIFGAAGPTQLSNWTGPRLELTAVVRVKKTDRHRAGMSGRKRASSLENAFRIRAPRLIEGRIVLVVDDLITTGGTAAEIARALLDGGARAVNILTLARAMNEFSQ